jgi:hypothetical protein
VLVWFGATIAITAIDFPTREKLQSRALVALTSLYEPLRQSADSQRTQCLEYISQKKYSAAMPCMKFAGEARQQYHEMVNGGMRRFDERVDHDLLEAQGIAIAKGLGIWLVPSLLVYLLGIGIAWAMKGFRHPPID